MATAAASACPALQHRAAQSVDTTFRICQYSDESGKQSLYPDGDPDRHQNLIILFTGPLPTFPANFMQIRSQVFLAQSC